MFVTTEEYVDWATCLKSKKVHWDRLIKKAADFATCAVGHQTKLIPRTISGLPASKELVSLGYIFLEKCESRDRKATYLCFKKITKVANSEAKKYTKQFKKYFKKNKVAQELFNNGQREFNVVIDKHGDIVGIKESKYTMEISDEIFAPSSVPTVE